jgi:hypothetical protein
MLQYGALGALVLFILVVFFYLIPGHNKTVRDVVADHKEASSTMAAALDRMSAQHERTTDRICAEIKSTRVDGRA